jgi:hypothetical protein
MALECRIEIKFSTDDPSIVHFEHGQLVKSAHQALRFETAVGLDITDDEVDPGGVGGARRLEHGVGFADARRRTEKDF